MTSIRYAVLNLVRNWKRYLLIILILTLILLSEMICCCLKESASRGEKEAFTYNGAAFLVDIDTDHVLTNELREKVLSIDHVSGISCWTVWEMETAQIHRSEAHTGYTVEQDAMSQRNANHFTLLTDIDVSMSKWFWKEPCVSLVEGEFPTQDNQGLLIERRVAEENGCVCGDEITFTLDGYEEEISLPICGIYQVDSDFEIVPPQEYDYESEDASFDVYEYSPYNRIYADYDVIAALIGEPVGQNGTLEIYVDSYESIDTVAPQLAEIVGEEYALYDRASKYLEDYGMLTLISDMAQMISYMAAIVGLILTLIVMTYFAIGFKFECGLMVMMGQSRRKVIFRYLLLTGLLVLNAIVLAILLYLLVGPELVQHIVDAANSYVHGNDMVYSFYSTSLLQPFSMTASITDLFTAPSLVAVLGTAVILLAGTALIPIWCVFQARPRRLLE